MNNTTDKMRIEELDAIAQERSVGSKLDLAFLLIPASFLNIFLCVLACFLIVHVGIYKANVLRAVPVAVDDYMNLGYSFNTLCFSPSRSISYFLLSLISAIGVKFFYLMITVLTVSYITLVFNFMARFFQLKRIFAPLLIICATAVVSFEYVVQYYNYTGVIVGLLAGNFAMGAMLVCVNALKKNIFPKMLASAAIVLSLLSIFSKEEFALPMILVSGWVALKAAMEVRNKAKLIMIIQFLLLSAAILIQKSGGSCFTSGAGNYHVNLSIVSVLKTLGNYLTASPGAIIALSCQIVSLLLTILHGKRQDKEKLVLLQAIIVCLTLPFSILPEHYYPMYAFDWIPWQCSTLICLSFWLNKPNENKRRILCALLSLFLLPSLLKLTEFDRINLLGFYKRESAYVTNIVNTIKTNRALLNKFPVVSVIGAKISSPWCYVRGDYFRLRLGITSRWKLFVPKDSTVWLLIRGPYANTSKDNVEILDIAELPSYGRQPCLELNQLGGGTLVTQPESK